MTRKTPILIVINIFSYNFLSIKNMKKLSQ
jgi:hypothetical protein